jgi:hypothetical protein
VGLTDVVESEPVNRQEQKRRRAKR